LPGWTGDGLRTFRPPANSFSRTLSVPHPRFILYRSVAEPAAHAWTTCEHMVAVAAAFRRVHLPDLDHYLDNIRIS